MKKVNEYANHSVGKIVAERALVDLKQLSDAVSHVAELNGADEMPEDIADAINLLKKYLQKNENNFLSNCVQIRKELTKK